MGLDGFSVNNIGLQKGITPAEITLQAQQLAQEKSAKNVKKIEHSDSMELKNKDDSDDSTNYEGRDSGDSEHSESAESLDNEKKEENSASSQTNLVSLNLRDEAALKKQSKKYKVIFNSCTNMVELIDRDTDGVIETVTPSDLINILYKSKGASGIFIDKAI